MQNKEKGITFQEISLQSEEDFVEVPDAVAPLESEIYGVLTLTIKNLNLTSNMEKCYF